MSSHQGELLVKVVFLSCDKWKDHMMYVPSHVIDLIILVQCQDVENILKYKVHLNFRIITALLSSRCTCGYFHKKVTLSIVSMKLVGWPNITNIYTKFYLSNRQLAQTKLYSPKWTAISANRLDWHFE